MQTFLTSETSNLHSNAFCSNTRKLCKLLSLKKLVIDFEMIQSILQQVKKKR